MPAQNKSTVITGGLHFALPMPSVSAAVKPKRVAKAKNDPRLLAAARELRDRWLEEVNSGRCLPVVEGKYDVSRAIENGEGLAIGRAAWLAAEPRKLLAAA